MDRCRDRVNNPGGASKSGDVLNVLSDVLNILRMDQWTLKKSESITTARKNIVKLVKLQSL